MTTFDEVLPKLEKLFNDFDSVIVTFSPVIVNRDLNGRIRLILDKDKESFSNQLSTFLDRLHEELAPHAYPPD